MGLMSESSRRRFSLLGRVVYGAILAFMALNGFVNKEEQIAYATSKNIPMPDRLVPLSHGLLLFGSLGIVFGFLRRVSAGTVAPFFIGVTPVMHDFWNVEDEEQSQTQMISFLKNTALLGAALSFLVRRDRGNAAG